MAQDESTPASGQATDATIAAGQAVLHGTSERGLLRRLLPFLGPAFIASVAYVDPGNFATNIAAGARYGYLLLWVIVLSNLMAMLIQAMSAKLGIATGLNLAEQSRVHFPRRVVWVMWVVMELVAMATDLAEFLGAALGLNLLFGIPLLAAGVITAIATFLILGMERYGVRPLEAVITALVGVVAVCYIIETILDQPNWSAVIYHAVTPKFAGPESVVLAAGILGATVMPHAIFLHSSLTQNRIVARTPAHLRLLFRYEMVDVLIAMTLAGLVNMAMLIMAAATFHQEGMTNVGTIEEAYRTLEPLLGPAASWVFAISLLASGLSSSSVGTMAGQVIMQGFLDWHIPVWVRRLITMAPALIVIALGLNPTLTLVFSQVLLSFGLPFAILPLIYFTSSRKIMGVLVNRPLTTVALVGAAAIILALNAYLIVQLFNGG
jgi:manganese transport protein